MALYLKRAYLNSETYYRNLAFNIDVFNNVYIYEHDEYLKEIGVDYFCFSVLNKDKLEDIEIGLDSKFFTIKFDKLSGLAARFKTKYNIEYIYDTSVKWNFVFSLDRDVDIKEYNVLLFMQLYCLSELSDESKRLLLEYHNIWANYLVLYNGSLHKLRNIIDNARLLICRLNLSKYISEIQDFISLIPYYVKYGIVYTVIINEDAECKRLYDILHYISIDDFKLIADSSIYLFVEETVDIDVSLIIKYKQLFELKVIRMYLYRFTLENDILIRLTI